MIAVAVASVAAPASAQLAGEVAFDSDLRDRGHSLSDEHPVASVTLSYDHSSGLYLNGSLLGVIKDGDPRFLGAQGSIGYATRVTPGLSLDGGVARSEFSSAYLAQPVHYTEVYAGLASRLFSGRVYYSPDYYRSGNSVLYGEVEAARDIARDWQLSAHLGTLVYLSTPPPYFRDQQVDWRVGTAHRFGPYGVHLDVSGSFTGQLVGSYPAGGKKTAVVVGVSRAF